MPDRLQCGDLFEFRGRELLSLGRILDDDGQTLRVTAVPHDLDVRCGDIATIIWLRLHATHEIKVVGRWGIEIERLESTKEECPFLPQNWPTKQKASG